MFGKLIGNANQVMSRMFVVSLCTDLPSANLSFQMIKEVSVDA